MRRRANADRLVECFTYGSISDVLDELQQQVWHENPDEIDWKSSLPSPHVPVDAITSLRVTLLAEALLVPREYEFRLAVVCLLLERGAQPCRHTENGRAIEAVLEQLPPSQQEGDYLWHLRHVLDIAVDCRLNRERFLISKHGEKKLGFDARLLLLVCRNLTRLLQLPLSPNGSTNNSPCWNSSKPRPRAQQPPISLKVHPLLMQDPNLYRLTADSPVSRSGRRDSRRFRAHFEP